MSKNGVPATQPRYPPFRRGSASSDVNMQDVDQSAAGHVHATLGPDHVYPSAYLAPAHPRAQAEPGHSDSGGRLRERGDLTADNLERIPEADHVAPGIRLENVQQERELANQRQQREQQPDQLQEHHEENDDEEDRGVHEEVASSVVVSGTSSVGAMTQHGSDDFHDADEDGDDKEMVHERVGGSGATSENASKGTSVGHFGPRGEAIPGVPPHLDPRQPHFRPPSPSAASVFSVAVQPPASPKLPAQSALSGGHAAMMSPSEDSGEETESFDNGVVTPTLSDENLEDEESSAHGGASKHPFGIHKLNLDERPASSATGPAQVSFNPVVTSHHRENIYPERAPSIAATAGSSRAPSTRGLSPPAGTSRAGTSSSIEEFGSTGTGLGGYGGETPSIGRSRQSSYSAPSSNADADMQEEIYNRARGATLVPQGPISVAAGSAPYGYDEDHDGPSLAPSEAGSDSTRSMTYESSTGHSAPSVSYQYAGSSTERFPPTLSSSPVVLEPSSSSSSAMGAHDTSTFKSPLSAPPAGVPNLLAIKKAARRQGSGAASTAGATAGTASPPSSTSVDGDFEDANTGEPIGS